MARRHQAMAAPLTGDGRSTSRSPSSAESGFITGERFAATGGKVKAG